ncbi:MULTISPECIES: SDR family NAD(P)-dependent oxidoreductase [unclassified Rhizobium]|uniref:SDR family NAD(P)-dependent oxidoreductase n=1 Tax=unclassified Rhizobium TaxID=2613769 RepID=UPI001AD9ABED|nr:MULTISPECIES: SDR family NAD(P)-dependent oxidoreductase [unclassified Rhizobium]MBO9123971.1 SDR family NAD(P)-dependent oxidoreductase [Rhizobium sp. 16-488-2b]MBO9174503.1 SDR family NAD(P)-dependent oxidoreductase [Rhizobium sp. 16-488-2a]
MPTILITGADRAFSLALAHRYATLGWQVIAAGSTTIDAHLKERFGDLVECVQYDPLDESSAERLAEWLGGRAIDMLFLDEGIPDTDDRPPEAIGAEHWRPIMLANTFAPLHLAGLLETNLRNGGHKILAAISSHKASIGDYDGAHGFAYRASKAALNQMWRNLSVEWRPWGCICLLLSPDGVVDGADTDSAAAGVQSFIETAKSGHSGTHHTYDGRQISW